MALNENCDTPGTYWHQLAQDQQAGTFQRCRCGELNPAVYDVCYSCQQPLADPTPAPAPTAGTVFTPTIDDMEASYGGVLVASLAEGEEVIAVTGDKRQALEAIDQYYRELCGTPNLLDDAGRPLTDAYYSLDCGYGVFTRNQAGGWDVTPAAEDAPGAVPVTWFRGAPVGPLSQPYARRDDPQLWGPSL